MDQEMDTSGLGPAIEGILFASGEAVSVKRIAAVLTASEEEVLDAAKKIADELRFAHRGIRLVRLEDSLQLCSAPELSDIIRQALETRKPPRLTQTALEVLAVVAYFQPVTRAYIEDLRGTDSSYTVGVLQERGLIEPCGTLDAPGRPTLFRTTPAFLRTFGLSSLDELPPLPQKDGDEPEQLRIEEAIQTLQEAQELEAQTSAPTGETPAQTPPEAPESTPDGGWQEPQGGD